MGAQMLTLTDAGIDEAIVFEFLTVVDIAAINDDVAIHDLADDVPGGHTELTPLCHQCKDIGTIGSIVEVLTIGDGVTDAPATLIHGDGVEDTDGGTILEELVDDHQGGSFTHIVGLRLEGEANDGDGLTLEKRGWGGNRVATHGTECLEDLVVDNGLLPLVDTLDGLDDLHVVAMVNACVEEGLDILGEAGAAIATASIEELRADAGIGAYALTNSIDIGTHMFAEVGDIVHEGYARGEHGIGCILGHLGRGYVHEDDTEVIDEEGLVEARHDLLGLLGLCANDHSVGRHEVLDSGSLLEELWIRGYIEGDADATSVEFLLNDRLDFLGSTYRNGGLGDEDGVFVDVLSELSCDSEDVSQVSGAIFVRRCAHGREDHFDIVENLSEVGGEVKAIKLDIAFDKLLESRLIDGHDAVLKLLDFLFINIDTGDMGTHLGKTCSTDQAYIAGSYYCYVHCLFLKDYFSTTYYTDFMYFFRKRGEEGHAEITEITERTRKRG